MYSNRYYYIKLIILNCHLTVTSPKILYIFNTSQSLTLHYFVNLNGKRTVQAQLGQN